MGKKYKKNKNIFRLIENEINLINKSKKYKPKIDFNKIKDDFINKKNNNLFIKLLNRKNNFLKKYKECIKIDNRLTINKKNNQTGHHIIPTRYELIPNYTIKYTIKWLIGNNIKEHGFRIKDEKLIINNTNLLFLTKEEHKKLHLYLEEKKEKIFLKKIKNVNKSQLNKYTEEKQKLILQELLYFYMNLTFKLKEEDKKYYIDRKNKQDLLFDINSFIYEKMEKTNESIRIQKKNTFKGKNINTIIKKEIEYIEMKHEDIEQNIDTINIDNELLRLLNLIPNSLKYNYYGSAIKKINEFYLKYNQLIINNLNINKIDIKEMILKGNSEIVSYNILSLSKYKGKVDEIFKLGIGKILSNIVIILDENYKIISGLPIIAFLLFNNYTDLKIKYIQI